MQVEGQVRHPVQSRRQSSPCLPKDGDCDDSRSKKKPYSQTHENHSQHTQAAVHCHLQQQCGCNKDAAAAVHMLPDSDQQNNKVKASEIQLMRVSCISQNLMPLHLMPCRCMYLTSSYM